MQRWDGAPIWKVPVPPAMLSWIHQYLLRSSRTEAEKAALWVSVCLGWFYMLRASEYLPSLDLKGTPSRALRESFRNGAKCLVTEADSQLRDSEGDQYGRGQVRLQHQTGELICPVRPPGACQTQSWTVSRF